MFRQMKFLIFAILLVSTMSLKLKEQSSAKTARDYIIYYDTPYVSFTPVYYTPSIIVSDVNWVRSLVAAPYGVVCSIEYGCYYDDGYYYYYDAYYTFTDGIPVYLWSYRKGKDGETKKEGENKKKESNTPRKVDLEKEMKALKKELFGKEEYNTETLRKENKAYDPRWLAAQLKIARVLAIEDLMVQNKQKKNESNSKSSDVETKSSLKDTPKPAEPAKENTDKSNSAKESSNRGTKKN